MPAYNKVILMGHMTRDPELRVTPRGTPICQFGIAVNRKYKDDSGAMKDETTFVDCEAWGKTADVISKYLLKGDAAFVEGRLKLDQWEDKQSGQKRSRLKVVVERVEFIGLRRDAASRTQDDPDLPRTTEEPAEPKKSIADEDVPF